MVQKIYISVPFAGDDYNYQRSYAQYVSTNLAQKGYEVITPFEICPAHTPFDEAMGMYVEKLLGCDAIYLCDGWQKSQQCQAELQVAIIFGKDVMGGK